MNLKFPEGGNPWYELFQRHASFYDQNPHTGNTEAEVDFMLEVFELPEGAAILDIGCGTGRHAIELARRGYRVTAVDFSPAMLAEARKKAEAAGVTVFWVEADATQYRALNPHDAAICVCEGAIGLVPPSQEPVAHDMAILKNIAASIKPNAPFLLTFLNAYAKVRELKQEQVDDRQFDPATMVHIYSDELELPEGKMEIPIKERLFFPPEMAAMLYHAGFAVKNIWGGTAGEWAKRPIKLDEIEVMAFCRKR